MFSGCEVLCTRDIIMEIKVVEINPPLFTMMAINSHKKLMKLK